MWILLLQAMVSKTMAAKTYRQFFSTTTVAATSGVVLAIAYMATNQQEDVYLLVTAQFVAVTCAIGWIFNMFFLALPVLTRRFSHVITMLILPKSYLAEDGHEWEMIRIRRELIAKRISALESFFSGHSAEKNSDRVATASVSKSSINMDAGRSTTTTIER